MDKVYVKCPNCGKKLFRIDKLSKYDNIYLWCKKCCKEVIIREPKSQKK